MKKHMQHIYTICIFLISFTNLVGASEWGCCEVIPPDSLEVVITADYSKLCEHSSIDLFANLVLKHNKESVNKDLISYKWSTKDTTKNIIVSEAGIYKVRVFIPISKHPNFPQYKIYESEIKIGYPELTDIGLLVDTLICGDATTEVLVSPASGYPDYPLDHREKLYDINWPAGILSDSMYAQQMYGVKNENSDYFKGHVLKGGNYNITITSTQTQCQAIKNFRVRQIPKIKLKASQEKICNGQTATIKCVGFNEPLSDYDFTWWKDYKKIEDSSGTEVEINGPGRYTLSIKHKNKFPCKINEDITIEDYDGKIDILNSICHESGMNTLRTNATVPITSYQWFEMDKEKEWRLLDNNTASLDILNLGKYKVEGTTKNGCIIKNQVDVKSLDRSKDIYQFFRSQGFYELKITDLKNIESKKEQNLCNNTITTDNRFHDDSFVQSFKLADEVVTNLDEIIESHLEYFQNQYFKDRSDVSAFLTSNNSLCACPDYIQKVKAKFQAQDYAFWIHVYEDENGNGSLFVLSNNKKSDGTVANFPGTGKGQFRRKNLVDKFLNILYSEQMHGENFESMPDNIIFIVMNSLLDVFGNL